MRYLTSLLFLATAALALQAQQRGLRVDPTIPRYKAIQANVQGSLTIIGDEACEAIIQQWIPAFNRLHPGATVTTLGKGSSYAPPALIEGSTPLVMMDRELTAAERDAFEKKYGYGATRLPMGVSAVALVVNARNPVASLTLQQVDALFSSTRKLGAPQAITTWGQLGLTGEWASKPVSLAGLDESHGIYAFFRDHGLGKGSYNSGMQTFSDAAGVAEAVLMEPGTIGFLSVSNIEGNLKLVPITPAGGTRAFEPTPEHVSRGSYPLVEFLYLYLNKPTTKPLSPLVKEFLNFGLSFDGQKEVADKGFVPLPADVLDMDLKRVNK